MTIVAYPSQELPTPVAVAVLADVEVLSTETLAALVYEAADSRPCQDSDPEDFFPLVGSKPAKFGGSRYTQEQDRARTLCAGCPVTAACLEYALRTKAGRHGVWGGTSEWERIEIRTDRIKAARAVEAVDAGTAGVAA